jgi:hypothetical protein
MTIVHTVEKGRCGIDRFKRLCMNKGSVCTPLFAMGTYVPSSPVVRPILPLLNGSTAAPGGFLGPPFAGIFPSYGEVASDHHIDQEIVSLLWASTCKAFHSSRRRRLRLGSRDLQRPLAGGRLVRLA